MQNPNCFNTGYPMNAERVESLETRSFSPSFRSVNAYQGEGSDNILAQQYLQSIQNINPKTSASVLGNTTTSDDCTMSSILNRVFPPNILPQMQPQSSSPGLSRPRNHPINEFNEQYNRLQHARMQQQMMTHNEAMMRKQQTFAMRQMLNPPTMSRQASAINLHQVNTSTQTTPNAHHQLFQNNFNPNNHGSYPESMRSNGMNNFNTNSSFAEDLAKTYANSKQSFSLNPFVRDADMNQSNDEGRCDSGAQSPVHQTIMYKEASSSSATSTPTKLLKSPKTKRQPTSLVTFSGWLYKQGSEGLRSWRRRWFVLSDYCLFYYKGPEEDKLLGSILLPSYVLSECTPSDNKAYRKFSFKLEHKNMRTYYLASENGDYMRKWMRVIGAATLMQNLQEIQTRKMLASSTPISTSMITAYDTGSRYNNQSGQHQGKMDVHSSLNPFLIFDEDNNGRQPLYVNAPPKPRRAQNETDYPVKTNDVLMFPYSAETSMDSTPVRLLEYEDIELEHAGHMKPDSINRKSSLNQEFGFDESSVSIAEKTHQKIMPPRPHSADFLEYESKRQFRRFKDFSLSGAYNERLPYRPKSSLDINSSTDNYYYSEASYAAKMRQSAAYLQNYNSMWNNKNDSRLNTLRYENDRKRLTNEFNNYTATYLVNNNRWASTLPRAPKPSSSNNAWRFSTLTRTNNDHYPNQDNRHLVDLGMRTPEFYNSSEVLGDEDMSGNENRMTDSQSASNNFWSPDISAGTLLSKTHEELVLLLIQLRRQNDIRERGLCRRLKDMDTIQQRLKNESDATATRLELMGKLEILREEVNKLEQQYEKTKPLVNLVDNMVKLGSLYRVGSMQWDVSGSNTGGAMDRLRSNQKDLERRIQIDDERQWTKYNPSQIELHNKVQQLYELDQRLQEESNNLQILQQDKYDIESTLEELNIRFATNQVLPENYIASKKIQHSLQLELCKVHSELAEQARRLEMTVSQNTKLERELLILRQKWQATREKNITSSNRTIHNNQTGDIRSVDAFESELRKVRNSVGDMKKQRDELSLAVSQLTLDTQEPIDQERAHKNENAANSYLNKRIESNWTETDIDSMHKKNAKNISQHYVENDREPFYYQYQSNMDDLNASDDHWQDKQEIKTVRIVKRESERRHREKDKSNYEANSANVPSQRESNTNEKNSYPFTYQADPRISVFNSNEPSTSKARPTIRNMKNSRNNPNNINSSMKNDNIFQSNTAKEILNEISNDNSKHIIATRPEPQPEVCTSIQSNQFKRITPRKKKRHNTAPNSGNFLDYMAQRDAYKYNNQRARDDLDMEVVLRSNPPNENTISGPPDIVRSALGSNSEYLFD